MRKPTLEAAIAMTKALVAEHVSVVRGYAVEGLPVPTNGEELVRVIDQAPASELELLDELAAAMQDASKLSEGAAKNSDGRSVSSSPRTSPPTAGPVSDVAARNTEPTQTSTVGSTPESHSAGTGSVTPTAARVLDSHGLRS